MALHVWLQEGLRLTQDQQHHMLAARGRVLMWLQKACDLRQEAYTAIGHDLTWLLPVCAHMDPSWLCVTSVVHAFIHPDDRDVRACRQMTTVQALHTCTHSDGNNLNFHALRTSMQCIHTDGNKANAGGGQ